ncbi:hypothetical protein V2J09_008449 [Rumex salicifolius]
MHKGLSRKSSLRHNFPPSSAASNPIQIRRRRSLPARRSPVRNQDSVSSLLRGERKDMYLCELVIAACLYFFVFKCGKKLLAFMCDCYF